MRREEISRGRRPGKPTDHEKITRRFLRSFRRHIHRLEARGGGRRLAIRRLFNSAVREMITHEEDDEEDECNDLNREECFDNENDDGVCRWYPNLHDRQCRQSCNELNTEVCKRSDYCNWIPADGNNEISGTCRFDECAQYINENTCDHQGCSYDAGRCKSAYFSDSD